MQRHRGEDDQLELIFVDYRLVMDSRRWRGCFSGVQGKRMDDTQDSKYDSAQKLSKIYCLSLRINTRTFLKSVIVKCA